LRKPGFLRSDEGDGLAALVDLLGDKSGARVRGRFLLSESRFRGAGMLMTTYDVTIEIENEKNPALTAKWITIIQIDPK
ncbi:hypothetical protein ACCT11_36440, partial [Rhizobium johnstonii]